MEFSNGSERRGELKLELGGLFQWCFSGRRSIFSSWQGQKEGLRVNEKTCFEEPKASNTGRINSLSYNVKKITPRLGTEIMDEWNVYAISAGCHCLVAQFHKCWNKLKCVGRDWPTKTCLFNSHFFYLLLGFNDLPWVNPSSPKGWPIQSPSAIFVPYHMYANIRTAIVLLDSGAVSTISTSGFHQDNHYPLKNS